MSNLSTALLEQDISVAHTIDEGKAVRKTVKKYFMKTSNRKLQEEKDSEKMQTSDFSFPQRNGIRYICLYGSLKMTVMTPRLIGLEGYRL